MSIQWYLTRRELTKGEFKVTKLYPSGISEEELLELAALAENYPTIRSLLPLKMRMLMRST